MSNYNILTNRSVDLLFLKHKRDDIALLMDLFFEHISKQKDSALFQSFIRKGEIDRFTLVHAIQATCGEVSAVSGHMRFLPEVDYRQKTVTWGYKRHHWLTWKDDGYIIDVLPYDGKLGVSVPQAVITTSVFEKRFFRDGDGFVPEISLEEKIDFDDRYAFLVNLLESLMEKVPF